MNDAALLAFHRRLVSIPSVTGQERAICDHVAAMLAAEGIPTLRVGDSLAASWGSGPTICFNTHLDTVPPTSSWRYPPFEATVRDGKVFGLGANDAKASAAAMTAAFLRIRDRGDSPNLRLVLTLVAGEETGWKSS